MPDYRLYHFDAHTGHIKSAEEMFAADDVAAAYEVQRRQTDHPLELWNGPSKIARVDAIPEMAAATRTAS
jgi:hypothetical protein